jgi:hypothetical protein
MALDDLVQAIDSLFAFLQALEANCGTGLPAIPESKLPDFNALDQRVFELTIGHGLAVALSKQNEVERPFHDLTLPALQFLGKTNLPGDWEAATAEHERQFLFLCGGRWQDDMLALRALGSKSSRLFTMATMSSAVKAVPRPLNARDELIRECEQLAELIKASGFAGDFSFHVIGLRGLVLRTLSDHLEAPSPPSCPGASGRIPADLALDYAHRVRAWATSWSPANTPPAAQPAGDPTCRRPGAAKGKRVDERMLAAIRDNQEAIYWSSSQWAENLKCSPSTVKESKTWKQTCSSARERARLASGRRLRRNKPK